MTASNRGVGFSLKPDKQLLFSFCKFPSGHTAPSSFRFDRLIAPNSTAPVRFVLEKSTPSTLSNSNTGNL